MGSPDIKFSFSTEPFVDRRSDVLMVPVFSQPGAKRRGRPSKKEAEPQKKAGLVMSPQLQKLDAALGGGLKKIAREEGYSASKGSLLVYRPNEDNVAAKRVILVGLGEQGKTTLAGLNKAYTKAFSAICNYANLGNVGVVTPELEGITSVQWVHVITDVAYSVTYRSQESLKPSPELGRVVLFTEKLPSVTLRKALKDAQIFAEAKSMVKDLVNKPANQKSPETFVEVAKTIAKETGIKVSVQDKADWIEKNMPCFYEVAKGSLQTHPPRFITLHYTPKGAGNGAGRGRRRRNLKKLALVGKTVVFDTGGYQVKTGDYMNTMKGDMTGGASVLAAIKAIAQLELNVEVFAYLAATPNKIDSDAMLPDSIVDTTCGKKVEIRHTDAEGRLTLIDAVAMAAKEEPEQLVTIATLTGSASIAVGHSIALMGNEENQVRDKVEKAARFLGEPLQTLDITEDDFEAIQSDMDGADIRNTQKGRGRGAQTAGAFVMCGAPDGLPMAHLDIAGGDFTKDEKATGIAVRALIQYVMNEAN